MSTAKVLEMIRKIQQISEVNVMYVKGITNIQFVVYKMTNLTPHACLRLQSKNGNNSNYPYVLIWSFLSFVEILYYKSCALLFCHF